MSAAGASTAAPLITVVVPTFNSAATLERALQSLAGQAWRDFEVVISDGASADGTLAIAQAFAPRLPALRIDSRPDAGVYDAINRGVALARGAWVLILGSDDRLHAPTTLHQVAPWLAASQAQVVYGDVRVMGPRPLGGPIGARYAGPLTLKRLLRDNVCQQAVFYRRPLIDALGGFNTKYRLWADWDFNVRAAFRVPMQWIDVVVSDYWTSGTSNQGSGDALFWDDLPELILCEFSARPHDRALWPAQHHLLRHGNHLRRRGQWARALRLWRAYVALRLKRLTAPAA